MDILFDRPFTNDLGIKAVPPEGKVIPLRKRAKPKEAPDDPEARKRRMIIENFPG